MYSRGYAFGQPPRPRSRVNWWLSLFVIIPVLGILATLVYVQFFDGTNWEGTVVDAYTGEPVSDAVVQLGDRQVETGSNGRFGLRSHDREITVTREGYDSTSYEISSDEEYDIEIPLRPNTMRGTVTHRVSEEPISGVSVEVRVDDEQVSSTETDDEGYYELTDIPEGAVIVFQYADHADVIEEIDRRTEMSVSMRPAVITGTVTDENGEPIRAATIAIEDTSTESNEDGTYRLEQAPETGSLFFKAPGYAYEQVELDDQMTIDVQLREKPVKAIYVTAGAVADEARFEELLDLVDRTELNAMVIDIKDSSGFVFYDTNVEMAHEIDAVRPTFNVALTLEKLRERDIYAIARQVVFEDPMLAEARNDLAIRDSQEGGLWRTWNGIAWVSAFEEEVWEYNIELMLEAVELGFDEIQLDYIRFPSDGPLNRAEYNVDEVNSDTRSDAVTEYLRRSHEAIRPTRAYLAGDIFGLTLWETGDGGIGQQLEKVTAELDYINPMIYPSHFFEGSMGFDIPNDHPYEVILWSIQNGLERMPDQKRKIRPWLQDFSYGVGRDYGPAEVRDQIQASDDFGATGWMLWNAASRYQEEALAPAP